MPAKTEFSFVGERLSAMAAAEQDYHRYAHLADIAQSRADSAKVLAMQALGRYEAAVKAAAAVSVKEITL